MKIGAVPLEKLEEKYSYENALILEVGADEERNYKTKYKSIISYFFQELNGKKFITVELDSKRRPSLIADARNLPFKESTFNIVILISVIEHCYSNFEKIIVETHRVLQPKGLAVGFVPFFLGYHGNDYWRFTYEGIERLLTDFQSVEIIPVGGPFSVSAQILTGMMKPLFIRKSMSFILSNILLPIDRMLWKIFKSKGKEPNFISRGYYFISNKGYNG